MFIRFVVVAMLAVSLLPTAGSAQTAAELLQKGIYTQETAGDLAAAIQIYRQVISSAGNQREAGLAAQAQYRLAQCLLQKGAKLDAAREFKKVIEGYPEEKDLVERSRESIQPLAHYLDEDYYDPVLGLSFTSSEWPVSEATRITGGEGEVQVLLRAVYNPPRLPHRADFTVVKARRSKMPSVRAYFEEQQKQIHIALRVVSTRDLNGYQVLSYVSDETPNSSNNNAPSVWCGVMIESGKTEVHIMALVPAKEIERNKAIIERIVESVRMP